MFIILNKFNLLKWLNLYISNIKKLIWIKIKKKNTDFDFYLKFKVSYTYLTLNYLLHHNFEKYLQLEVGMRVCAV